MGAVPASRRRRPRAGEGGRSVAAVLKGGGEFNTVAKSLRHRVLKWCSTSWLSQS